MPATQPAGHTVRRDWELAELSQSTAGRAGSGQDRTKALARLGPEGKGRPSRAKAFGNVERPEGRSCNEGRRNSAHLSWKRELERDMTVLLKYRKGNKTYS